MSDRRPMSLTRILVRNIASSWAGYGAQVIVAFALTPYILGSLGQTRYGIWALALGLTGYYGLLDLGLGAGITQYLTRYLAVKDYKSLNAAASTGVVALTSVGALVLLVSVAIAFSASSLFRIPSGSASEVAMVIAITGASVGLQFAFFTYSAVLTALQRFDVSNGIGIATRLLSALATVLCLKLGYGLVGLSIVMAGTNVVDYLLRWRAATRLIPEMKVSPTLANRRHFGEAMEFGLWNIAIAGSVRLISYTDSLVIAAFMPVAAVAPFAVAANLRTYFEEIFVRVGYVFFPVATKLDAEGDRNRLKVLYLVSSKLMFLGSICCGSIAMCWAGNFFRLWIGAFYAEPAGYPTVTTLFSLLLLGSIVGVAQRIGYQVLVSIRRIRLLAILFAVEGLSNLAISLALVRSYGLLGVALGTLLPAVVVQGVLQPMFVCRSLDISCRAYCRQVLLRPGLVGVVLIPFLLTFWVISPVTDWPALLLWSALSGVLMIPLVVGIGLERSERDLLMQSVSLVFSRRKGPLAQRRVVEPASASSGPVVGPDS